MKRTSNYKIYLECIELHHHVKFSIKQNNEKGLYNLQEFFLASIGRKVQVKYLDGLISEIYIPDEKLRLKYNLKKNVISFESTHRGNYYFNFDGKELKRKLRLPLIIN